MTELKTIPVAWRPPFTMAGYYDERPHGQTLLEIVQSVPDLPPVFLSRGVVCINGMEIDREHWHVVRPKPSSAERPIAVTMHLPLQGGGGGGGSAKAIGAIVASLALVVLTAGIATFGIAAIDIAGTTLFAAGSISATVLAGAVGLAGALAISALTAPPTVGGPGAIAGPGEDANTDQKEAAAANGNIIDPGGSIPRVLGTRKTFPPFVCEPLVELVDDDEYVEALCALNGPHLLTDVRINDVGIDSADDVQVETREGWDDDAAVTLVTRQGRTIAPQIQLSVHTVDSDNQNRLAHQSDPDGDLPVWHQVTSRISPDEIWLHLLLPNGISVNGSTSTDIRIPLRAQIRKRGDVAWINLPEFHLSDSTLQQRRRAIIFKFENDNGGALDDRPPQTGGFTYANVNVPAQTASPATSGWVADSYFVAGSGADYLNASNIGASKVQHMALFTNRVEVYLDPATFTAGAYEIRIMRGSAFQQSSFSDSAYTYSGSVKDFFTYSGNSPTFAIPMSRSNLADVMQLIRVCSVWNEHPVQTTGLALIALKARNRNVQRISVSASGYVKDWVASPAGWTNWTTTSNPAPHYVDVLSGELNIDPLPDALRDDTSIVAWRTLCAANDWTCDAIVSDMRTVDVLSLLASCGYARPYQSDVYSVVVDNDRSADSPAQIFSRVNCSNVRMQRAFARVPDGFIITFRDDEAVDGDRSQIVVYQRDRSIATTGLFESVSYDGLTSEAKISARAQFDLDQGNLRSTFYYLDTDAEALVIRKGSLVGLQHDALLQQAGSARIASKLTTSPANITGFVLDSEIPITNEPDMMAMADILAVADMMLVGFQTAIAIRRRDGSISTHALSNATGSASTVTLSTMINDTNEIEALDQNGYQYGCMITAGLLGTEYRRLLVTAINPTKDLKATLTLVDEAPDLVRYSP